MRSRCGRQTYISLPHWNRSGLRWLAGVLAILLAPQIFAAELTTLAGKKITGDVSSIGPTGITIKTKDGTVTTPIAEVLLVELGSAAPQQSRYTEIELIDGTMLRCSAVRFPQQQARLTLQGGPVVEAPLSSVGSMLNDAQDAKIRQEWLQLVRKRGQYDLLALPTDGKLDALDGTFGTGNTAGDAIEFTVANADQKVTPKLAQVQGLIFVRKPVADVPAMPFQVTDVAGNLLVARQVRMDGDAVELETVAGGRVRFPSLKSLARIDFSKGKLAYLSDLDPIEKDLTSTEEMVFPFRRDRNLYGGPLRLHGTVYSKGLALHSRTVLTYDIGADYKEFRAVLGVDDVVRAENGLPVLIRVAITGDGRELFRADVRDADPPMPIALDVKNVRRLKIAAAAPQLDLGNQVNLCDAKVSK